ncbi:hypothetical protein EDD30_3796 [Couchioplanes caeruleus]|uniref:DUF4397 domain-containing protein n=2 Tax=Couchioplanes caeruleus TaxID=56438 RepID=A0A3N1GL33_9ACTN|nr:hypothetical protein EDD30_3796 [Couchioplanes caeruleus]
MIVRVLRAAVLAAALALGGCSLADDGGRDYNPAHQPDYVLPAHDGSSDPAPLPTWPGSGTGLGLPGLGQAAPSEPDQSVRGGTGYAAKPYTFQLASGADVVRVSVADLGGALYDVSTPGDSKAAPTVDVDKASVVARLRNTGKAGPSLVTVLLARDVRWHVRLTGGASDEAVDLTGATLGGDVELSAGTSRAEVTLPAAAGTQKVALSGGASLLEVRLGGSAPVRVAARDGAGDVRIDGQPQAGVAGGFVYAAPGWETAKDRFDIDAAEGVSSLTVTHG